MLEVQGFDALLLTAAVVVVALQVQVGPAAGRVDSR
mgnify:FL=1